MEDNKLKQGDIVYDTVKLRRARIEKIDKAGYVLLDASLGKSTGFGRKKYIEEHGTDDRYSIPIGELQSLIIQEKLSNND